MMRGNRNRNGRQQDFSPFVPLVLFIALCILLTGVCILREFRKKPLPPPPPPREISKPAIKRTLPRKTGKVRIALVIDDMGWNKEIAKEIEKINRPLTLSFLPKAPYSKTIFDALKNNRKFELILHVPLEPAPPAQCFDRGLLRADMSDEEITLQFRDNMKDFYPHVKGFNNHMGSLFTTDEKRMRILLQEARSRDMFFVDSMTSKKSVGYDVAKEMGLKTARRDIFIDNEEDTAYIEKQIRDLVETARKKGTAIGIGHARKNTISVLQKTIPEMEKDGVEIVPVSTLLE